MAKSHLGTAHSKKLCGIFLTSVMMLGGCSTTQPRGDTPPPEPEPTPHPTHTPVPTPPPPPPPALYDTTKIQVTGEEEYQTPVLFSRLEKDGDPRIRRIIARLRMSSVGEEMYQYAARNNIQFLWETGEATRKGAYYYNHRRIVVDSWHSDDGVLSTLSHEIRHAWQHKTLNVTQWVLEPADHWRMSQMIEADSCAFNAHFVANYKDETGYMLNLRNSFSRRVSEDYTNKPAAERNYMQDALEPCLKTVLRPYSNLHMKNLRAHVSRNTQSFNEAATSRAYKIIYRSGFNTLDTNRKSALFMRFINDTLDSKTILPDATEMTAESFLKWVEERTPFRTPEDEQEVQQMEQDFRVMRQKLINALN